MIGVSDDRLWRVLKHHVGAAREREDFGGVRRVGIDETSSRRGQRYISVFHDVDERRLLFATHGRDASTCNRFAQDLAAHGGNAEQITDVAIDLSAAYQAGARQHLPNAAISFDPFHVVALASKALDEVRRAEVKHEPNLKGSRWALLKSPRQWTREQIDTMHWLQRSSLKTARAWRLKEALRDLFADRPSADQARHRIQHWIGWARRCRLAPFKKLANTLREHLDGVVRHFASGLSNGYVESMNSQIQAAKARARGYATHESLIVIAYLLCAKLKHLPDNPWVVPAQSS